MTPPLEEQRRRWQAFAAQVAQLANDHGIDGIAMSGLIRYEDQPTGGIAVLAYAGLSPELGRQLAAGVGWAVVDGVRDHFYKAVRLMDEQPASQPPLAPSSPL